MGQDGLAHKKERYMIEEFHIRLLGKAYGMDMLSKLAGFVPPESVHQAPVMMVDRVERDPAKRRGVLLSLLSEGYLEEVSGDSVRLTDKAFSEIETETWQGQLSIGNPSSPLATWLSGGIIKQALSNLLAGDAMIVDGPAGKVVVSKKDGRSEKDRVFDEWFLANFRELARNVADMSEVVAQGITFRFTGGTSESAYKELLSIEAEQQKELERLRRSLDAITVFKMRLRRLGGWESFLELARLEHLSSLNAEASKKSA